MADGVAGGGDSDGGGPEIRAELDEEALRRWGRALGEAVTDTGDGPGLTVALFGPLGAGKTTLVRAACRGAGVEGEVRSPTFTLHNHHRPRGRRPIHHVDLYRLDGPGDLDDLGWDGLVDSDGVVFVEWAGRAGPRLPASRWEVRLDFAAGDAKRSVEAVARGGAPPIPAPVGQDPAAAGRAAGRDGGGC